MRRNSSKPARDPRLVGRRAPFFEIAEPALFELWLSMGLRLTARGPSIFIKERELLEVWLQLSQAGQAGDVIDADQVEHAIQARSDTPPSKAYLRQSLSNVPRDLYEAGLLERREAFNGRPGASRIYRLKAPEEIAREWHENSPTNVPLLEQGGATPGSKAEPSKAEALYEVLVANNLVGSSINLDEPWAYQLISQLMEKCSRSLQTDPRETITASVSLGGEIVTAEAGRIRRHGEEDPIYGLTVADDSQIILALMTVAMQKIIRDAERGITPTNWVSVDLLALAKRLNRGNELATYRAFQRGMVRIINTEYTLTFNPRGKIAQQIKERIGMNGHRMRLRMADHAVEGADERNVSDETWQPQQGMRYFSFSLHPLIWGDLLRGHGLMVHPGLLYERSGLTHKIYNHLRAHATTTTPYRIKGDALLKMINHHHADNDDRPTLKNKRFCERVWALFREHATQSLGLLNVDDQQALHLNFFDLELTVTPIDDHSKAMLIEARHSEETRRILEKQEERTRQALINLSTSDQRLLNQPGP